MNKHTINLPAGRPKGRQTFNPKLAKVFGLVLRKTRVHKKLTQIELGYLADLPGNHVGKIERGENLPTLGVIMQLAAALNVSAGVLVIQTEKIMKGKVYQELEEDREL